jgi:two-component system CheB/CheR fusion protein
MPRQRTDLVSSAAHAARSATRIRLATLTKAELVAEVQRLRRRYRQQASKPGRIDRPGPLQRALEHYLDLYDFAPVMYLLLDSCGLVVHLNLAGARMLGVERAHVMGHPLIGRFVPDDRRRFLEHMRRCRTQDGLIESELRLQAAAGELPCRFYSKRGNLDSREVFPTIVTETSEQTALEEARLKALLERDQAERDRRAARASSAAKDQFIAMVSHELRTPLTPALIAASRLAGWSDLPAHARNLADAIRRNIEIEARLIDDLLDIARISRGTLELRREDCDVHRALGEAIRTCASTADARRVFVRADLGAGVHHANADEARLRQVFWNLLNNAIKFSEPGGTILVRTTSATDDLLRITVRDNGAGMDRDAVATLFSPFEPADHTNTRGSRHGLGLGLTICKGIVDAHGGHIWATSDGPGQGSTFEVELPAFRTFAPASREREAEPAGGRSRNDHLRILVIEDDPDTSTMMQLFLSQDDHCVELAVGLHSGVQRLAEGWDVIVSDIGLPDGSGLDVARRARALSPRPRLIALSGYGSANDVRASQMAGFDEHLIKPIDFDRLLEAIHIRAAGR